ncbi:aspartate carbamoyltransferase catalytic subunit [Alteribacillus iranensis]|uniref:Aspartate carbamoyltransferase n=1 Tax=Alteribacillus iranensis TaxID=930128 RepID=A0A1I2A903_9BACI|nr:aspartate carbamoyltransferase catalytic subunit [Alteribacillus iranensis]SFE40441.1 aspartate carbamoyltransferase [Alteribacillus iranensis]
MIMTKEEFANHSDIQSPRHVFRAEDWEEKEIHALLDEAENIAQIPRQTPLFQRLYAVNLFYEPSTRTKLSFEAAERNLGLEILPFATDSSSVQKGESLYDTVKTLESIGADVVVIRHSQEKFFDDLRTGINIPIINGGDGCGNHPTQSLLDLMTIRQEFGSFQNINVVIAGDISHSRVARSNISLLRKLGANVTVSGPEKWIPDEYRKMYQPMDEAIPMADVMMMLRIQHERHHASNQNVYSFHSSYGLTTDRESRMKKSSIIMHPGPVNRGVEIADELVECKRSRIFKQMQNGVFARMSLLKHVLRQS